jgi:hypothetical protein
MGSLKYREKSPRMKHMRIKWCKKMNEKLTWQKERKVLKYAWTEFHEERV